MKGYNALVTTILLLQLPTIIIITAKDHTISLNPASLTSSSLPAG